MQRNKDHFCYILDRSLFIFQVEVMLLLVGLALALACHPESRWMCDNPCGNWSCNDPICTVLCDPICDTTCVCYDPERNVSYANRCQTYCPPHQCEADSCPSCETYCPYPCQAGYIPLCEATSCQWECHPDPTCPRPACEQQDPNATCSPPRCELMSERPACEYNGSSRLLFMITLALL